jgi:protein SCO1/2
MPSASPRPRSEIVVLCRLSRRQVDKTVLLLADLALAEPSFKSTDNITSAVCCKDFHLTDHKSKARTIADFRGKVVVLFFGFTQCADVCPTTLAEMNAVLQQLGADAQRVQVLFVTLDPERDTPELLSKYVPSFNQSFLGLYGDMKTLRRPLQKTTS